MGSDMQNRKIQRRPSYAIESVDNALRLLQMLRDEDAIRVRDAAAELGVATSTAHRLLSMLVYRGFAIQDESRRYLPGLALGASPVSASWTSTLRMESMTHLAHLRDETGETAHLAVRVGDRLRFLATLESRASLRVGDLRGAVLPAHQTAAGIILLADLGDEQIARMYTSKDSRGSTFLPKPEFTALMKLVHEARRTGYSVNRGRAEQGVGSVGFAVRLPSGRAIASIVAASPLTRLDELLSPKSMHACHEAVMRVEEEIFLMGLEVGRGDS